MRGLKPASNSSLGQTEKSEVIGTYTEAGGVRQYIPRQNDQPPKKTLFSP
jgi:hypothetical protein